jgi:hypothetical protein
MTTLSGGVVVVVTMAMVDTSCQPMRWCWPERHWLHYFVDCQLLLVDAALPHAVVLPTNHLQAVLHHWFGSVQCRPQAVSSVWRRLAAAPMVRWLAQAAGLADHLQHY